MKKDRTMASKEKKSCAKAAKKRRVHPYDLHDWDNQWSCACGCKTKEQHEWKHSEPLKDLSDALTPDWIDSTGMHIFMNLLAYIAICFFMFIFLFG